MLGVVYGARGYTEKVEVAGKGKSLPQGVDTTAAISTVPPGAEDKDSLIKTTKRNKGLLSG